MAGILGSIAEGWREGKAEAARRNVLIHYECELLEKMNYSPQEFYQLVQKNIAEREVPDLEAKYLMMRQGGVATARRLYLQLRRKRLFIEICGMPFGTGFFVSERVFHRRPYGPALRLLLGLLFLVGFVGSITLPLGRALGVATLTGTIALGVVTFTALIALVWSLMRLAATNMADTLDRALADFPILGSVYLWLFHPDTYFEQDTNKAYQKAATNSYHQAVKEVTTQKGVKPADDESGRPFVTPPNLR